MLSAIPKGILKASSFSSRRTFTAAASTIKTKQYPPSERKIKREKRKEERLNLAKQYEKLDEEANKSSFEKKWKYNLSLYLLLYSPRT